MGPLEVERPANWVCYLSLVNSNVKYQGFDIPGLDLQNHKYRTTTSGSGDVAEVNTNFGSGEVSANSSSDSSWFSEGDRESHQMGQYSLWLFCAFIDLSIGKKGSTIPGHRVSLTPATRPYLQLHHTVAIQSHRLRLKRRIGTYGLPPSILSCDRHLMLRQAYYDATFIGGEVAL
ncbi:60S ribosomal protein L23 [Datura stramonium]|uniref:60S ribosomal protein L23 n=1 Tax=Datura stramonium TaxID=4076 RepID=A0ABS8W3F8_DATST|nr:60S ribosomal protein L23 [Datura stramonium]